MRSRRVAVFICSGKAVNRLNGISTIHGNYDLLDRLLSVTRKCIHSLEIGRRSPQYPFFVRFDEYMRIPPNSKMLYGASQ